MMRSLDWKYICLAAVSMVAVVGCAHGSSGDGGSGGESLTSTSTGASPCGNNKLDGDEKCDDGNAVNGDGCSAVCIPEIGYTCSGASSVCVTTCGDGVSAGDEKCDDGNAQPYDGCDAHCQVEPHYTCTGTPSVCAPVCGDGIITAAEKCDDGNTAGGDGCSDTCAIESGFTCSGIPSVCVTHCGDGIPAGPEGCDDGANVPGDGCDAGCHVESGYMCTGTPSVCMTVCGDGILAGNEACDDGNTNDADGCTNSCTKGILVVAGNNVTAVTAALVTLGETYLVSTGSQWGTPSDVGVIIVANSAGGAPYPDYTAHVDAGAHFLSIGGTQDSGGFTAWISNYLATDNTSSWHESINCTPDWTRTNATGIAQFMPATFEFANQNTSFHMVHLANIQAAGTTLYGQTCDNPSASGLLAVHRYVSKGTFAMMGLDLGAYATPALDPQAQTNFLVPLIKGYLSFVRSPP